MFEYIEIRIVLVFGLGRIQASSLYFLMLYILFF